MQTVPITKSTIQSDVRSAVRSIFWLSSRRSMAICAHKIHLYVTGFRQSITHNVKTHMTFWVFVLFDYFALRYRYLHLCDNQIDLIHSKHTSHYVSQGASSCWSGVNSYKHSIRWIDLEYGEWHRIDRGQLRFWMGRPSQKWYLLRMHNKGSD